MDVGGFGGAEGVVCWHVGCYEVEIGLTIERCLRCGLFTRKILQ